MFCSSEGRSRLEIKTVRHPAEFVIEVVGFKCSYFGREHRVSRGDGTVPSLEESQDLTEKERE